jgi:hypothetical protein
MTNVEDRVTLGGLASIPLWTFVILPLLYSTQADAAEAMESLKWTEWLLVAFTAGLFLATCGLWWATRGLVRSAERTAERQLRAYVFARAQPIRKNGLRWECDIELKNSGQTPAYRVTVDTRGAILPQPPDEAFFVIAETPNTGSIFSMPSDGAYNVMQKAVITEDDVNEIRLGKKAWYVFGEIRYRDAFNRAQNSKFRFCHDKSMIDTTRMFATTAGNEET